MTYGRKQMAPSHLSERTLANDLDRPKVRQADLGSSKPEML